MALWKDPVKDSPTPTGAPMNTTPETVARPAVAPVPSPEPARRAPAPAGNAKESLIAADVSIEGKIEGSGHIRIAGKFKGDIKVQGNLGIDQGAKVSGGVSANKVTLAGDLEGNISGAQQVELLSTGVINGDLKAGSLTVAAGSRIRGHVECGWGKDDKPAAKPENGSAA